MRAARPCNALLMNTKNFIKDCLYIKLSTKLCRRRGAALPGAAPTKFTRSPPLPNALNSQARNAAGPPDLRPGEGFFPGGDRPRGYRGGGGGPSPGGAIKRCGMYRGDVWREVRACG